jgi:hypothetical protein
MLEILSQVGLSTSQFLALFAISTIVLILAYRPFVISIFDPLNMFIVAMIADAVLMFGLDWDSDVKVEFTFFLVFFWIGFAFAGKAPTESPVIRFDSDALQDLEIILLFASVIIVAANLYLGFTVGFPLLSANPSDTKVTAYTGGLGIIRHVNQGPYLFLCCGCALLIAIGRRPKFAITMLVVSSAFVAFCGSKSALLPIFFVQAFVSNHKGLGRANRQSAKMKRFAIPGFAAAVAVTLTVVVRENGGLAGGVVALARRILFFGDVILFYYPRRGAIPELMGAGLLDYLHYLVDPILAMFRVLDYTSIRPPLGSIISGLDDGFGPNGQYFVRADIFFGPVFGSLYCLLIGYLTGIFRKQFFTFRTRSAVVFTFSLLLAAAAVNVPFESSLFVSMIVDAALFLCPLWCFAHMATLSTAVFDGVHEPTTRT